MFDVSRKRKLAKKSWFNICHLRPQLICFPLFEFLNCTPSARGAHAAAHKAEAAAGGAEQHPGAHVSPAHAAEARGPQPKGQPCSACVSALVTHPTCLIPAHQPSCHCGPPVDPLRTPSLIPYRCGLSTFLLSLPCTRSPAEFWL